MKRLFTGKTNHILLLIGIFTIWGIPFPSRVYCQRILERSEKLRPVWLNNSTPKPSNETFHYQITEGEHRNLQDARHSCLLNLSTYIKRSFQISEQAVADIQLKQENGQFSENENYQFSYDIQGEKVTVISQQYDEYWEYVEYPNGERVYRCYTLYGIADQASPSFNHLSFSRKYGARGFVRSLIVPGWGQLYKGNTTKGICILGGEIALATGILVAESLRSSYAKKMYEQPQHLATYNTKADNWENVRNICIGTATALYVYNLIDALVANGRKRSITHKTPRLTAYPATGDCNGLSLALSF